MWPNTTNTLLSKLNERFFSLIVVICAVVTVLHDGNSQQHQQQSSFCHLQAKRANDGLWKPRVVAYHYKYASSSVAATGVGWYVDNTTIIHSNNYRCNSHRPLDDARDDPTFLLDSDEHSTKTKPMMDKDDCVPQYDWQVGNFPTCNMLHEKDLTDFWFVSSTRPQKQPQTAADDDHGDSDDDDNFQEKLRYLASGSYRQVFMIRDDDITTPDSRRSTKLALKTLKYRRNFTESHADRHRRDAVIADRLTSTKESLDIYAFCGNSAIYQFAHGGTLKGAINKYIIANKKGPGSSSDDMMFWNMEKRLLVAYQVAASIAAVHNVDEEGKASIAHTDISTDQFVSIDLDLHSFKINDFNRARFLFKNVHDNSTCPFHVKSNKGKFRSPEEYNYEAETEAIDVYSMGNIFFVLVTGKYPFEHLSRKLVKKVVGSGMRPDVGRHLEETKDSHIETLITAAKMCWVQDPNDRATARQVQLFLQSRLPF
jgi:Protein kinase domain